MITAASINESFNLVFLGYSRTIVEIKPESFSDLSCKDIFSRTGWSIHVDSVTHCNLFQDRVKFRVQDFILHPVFGPIRQRDHVFNPLRNLISKNFSNGVINFFHHLISDVIFNTTEQTGKSAHRISETRCTLCTLGAGCTLCRCCRCSG